MDYVRILRVHQWYKNVVIFIALFFTGRFFHVNELYLTFLGFIALCFVSSANYVINDIADRKEDQKHPEKKNRPIASGRVGVFAALVLALVMLAGSILIAWTLTIEFLIIIIALFVLTQVYTFIFRNEAFVDVILIGVFFVLRAVSGAFIIDVDISPWLIVCAFFLALYLGFGKRHADLDLLGRKAARVKKVYNVYTKSMIDRITGPLIAILIIAYSLYTFLKADGLIFTIPVVVYGLYRYLYLIDSQPIVARKPERALLDFRILASVFIWGAIIFSTIYLIT